MASTEQQQQLFTCLSCSIAFFSAEEQRVHYRSDHHRYNMKRRVAGLPPITATLFNQRVLERKAETAITTSAKSMTCELCSKAYNTENSYKSHLQSKKHKDRELNGPPTKAPKSAPADDSVTQQTTEVPAKPDITMNNTSAPEAPSALDPSTSTEQPANEEEEIERSIEEKIAAARARLSNLDCLFCDHKSSAFEDNLTHMSIIHSFFIPDADYLIDIQGLITYLGEKIAVGNVCIFCNDKSKSFRSLDATRRHMLDKGHCKIAYDSSNAKLEVADYYDFSSSYPDAAVVRRKTKAKVVVEESQEWEDIDEDDDGQEADEVVDVEMGSDSGSDDEESEDDLPENQLAYGDSEYELVLPSGARIGHRSMKRYYAQSFTSVIKGGKNPDDPNSGAALVRKLIADKNSCLVPTKGGFGAFGAGTAVVKARNRGEAKEAGRHVKEFRDMRRREEFKTKVGYRHNSQKHFRDPLLQ